MKQRHGFPRRGTVRIFNTADRGHGIRPFIQEKVLAQLGDYTKIHENELAERASTLLLPTKPARDDAILATDRSKIKLLTLLDDRG